MARDIVFEVWRQSGFCCAFLIIPPANLTLYGHSNMDLKGFYDSAGNMLMIG